MNYFFSQKITGLKFLIFGIILFILLIFSSNVVRAEVYGAGSYADGLYGTGATIVPTSTPVISSTPGITSSVSATPTVTSTSAVISPTPVVNSNAGLTNTGQFVVSGILLGASLIIVIIISRRMKTRSKIQGKGFNISIED